ncbi:hypothetical protein [Psychroflexus aestuariivivens]|uniref:hypothetical protein n=1 Tax=Psychroflexus aestuariivivens TaxID=1795040 RepID=UPI000FDC7FED|nr:hypothetical protein [Psychroflexus aestuariivivens]
MQTLTGNIKEINTDDSVSFPKKILELQMPFGESAFIEFRGTIMTRLLEDFDQNELVQINIVLQGSISKKSGLFYNNLVARTIKSVTQKTKDYE